MEPAVKEMKKGRKKAKKKTEDSSAASSPEKPEMEEKMTVQEEEVQLHKEPGFLKHVYEKSKRTAEESLEVESVFISFLIAWTSFCPSLSIMEASKRLCKDDLVDELMIIDAIADNPRRRALGIYFKTVFNAISRNVGGYFKPLLPTQRENKKG